MKRWVLLCGVLGLAVACGGDPEPGFTAPEITEVTVSATAQSADITFRVTKGDASHCGVNLSENAPGAAVLRVEGILSEGLAEVKLARLTAGTAYRFTPWADNGKFEIKGEEHTFTTAPLPDVRIYELFCSSPTTSTVAISFRYTAPERVVSACLWCWPADGSGLSDPKARRIPIAAMSSGNISLIVSGLEQNTAYNAQPFIYTEEGEIAGPVQQFSTLLSEVKLIWDSISFVDTIPHYFSLNVGVKNHTVSGPVSIYYFIQKGDTISFDENSKIAGPLAVVANGQEEIVNLRYFFADPETQYTVLPFARSGSNDYLGSPRTFSTGAHSRKGCRYPFVPQYSSAGFFHGQWNVKNCVKDAVFRKYLLDHFDTDGDGKLNCGEADAVTSIDCRNLGIKTLEGIERFQNVESVNCSGNPVAEIDFTFKQSYFSLGSDYVYCRPMFLKELIALDMNDSAGNNVLKRIVIGETVTNIVTSEDCIIEALPLISN